MLELFCHLIGFFLGQSSMKGLRVTKNVKTIKFERVSNEVQSKRKVLQTIPQKIIDTNSSFHMK